MEYKFKAYVKVPNNNGQNYSGIYPVIALQTDLVVVERSSAYCESMFDINDVEVIQFTGQVDKNGKEYYQFDIYKRGDTTLTYIDWNNEHSQWWLYYVDGLRAYPFTEEHAVKGENIGNKLTNPELLEDK